MRRGRTRPERGAVLIEVALLVFGVLAVAALVVDLGLAFLTQDQMQTATDLAALEGLRWRDEVDDPTRRAHAAAMLGVVFDDNLSPEVADPDPYGLGAGPILSLVGGTPDINAGAIIDVTSPTVYKPNAEGFPLQPNESNLPHGDLVSGVYHDDDPYVSHVEAPDYLRDDFTAEDSGDAFLARMRRTRDPLDLDQEPDVSSSGPTLPLLFGLGAAISGGSTDYDPRSDGITIRATSIASAKRALRVSGGPATFGALPLAPLTVQSSVWQSVAAGDPISVGLTFVTELDPTQDATSSVDFVGERAAPIAASPGAIDAGEWIVPIAADVDGSGVNTVIGFGIALISTTIPAGTPAASVTITKRGERLPRSGTTAKDLSALRALAASPDLRAAHAALDQPVLAAVLVR